MPRPSKNPAKRLLARERANALRVELAERECAAAERARDAAHERVKAAFIELGRALLAGEVGAALRGRK